MLPPASLRPAETLTEETAPFTTRRMSFNELAFLEITESNQEHGGMGKGTYKEHRLLWDPDIVFKMDPDSAHKDTDH